MEQGYHIGIDLHKKFSQVAVLNEKGVVLDNRRVDNDPPLLTEHLSSFPKETPVTLEATIGYEWMSDLLAENGFEIKLANPKKVRLIAEATIKTDKVDAVTLAQLERANFLPTAYLPPKEVRDSRELLRHRMKLVNLRKGLKNRIHAVLAKRGILFYPVKDIFGKAGREFLSSLPLPDVYQTEVDSYLSLIDQIDSFVKEREKDIKDQVVKENKEAQLLLTIPGISYFSALLLVSEIGDIKRFPSPKKLASYAGLTGTISESADKVYQGALKKDSNKYIRWILIEAVDHAIKKDPGLFAFHRKIAHKKGENKARVAVAHKLLISIYFMLKNNQVYQLRNNLRVSPLFVMVTDR
ncbi:MAG: IS110 family transposase [Candidatus Omnitrophota bacterium]